MFLPTLFLCSDFVQCFYAPMFFPKSTLVLASVRGRFLLISLRLLLVVLGCGTSPVLLVARVLSFLEVMLVVRCFLLPILSLLKHSLPSLPLSRSGGRCATTCPPQLRFHLCPGQSGS